MAAIFSPCQRYRYRLDREISMFGPVGAFIMVNPSTADASQDDQTIRKVRGFAAQFGWSRFIVGNVFGYRATDIKKLAFAQDPVGPENSKYLNEIFVEADELVVAWGRLTKLPRELQAEWMNVLRIAQEQSRQLLCLRIAKDGHPSHPLMLPYSVKLAPWVPPDQS